MSTTEKTTGLVLAGGAGRRAAGRDKGLIEWRGQALVSHVLKRLAPQVDSLIISCNRNRERYRSFGYPLVSDRRPDFQGPLAGVEPVANLEKSGFLILVPCDTPELPHDLVERLLHPFLAAGSESLDVAYAHDGEREQYLCAALRCRVLASLGNYLDDEQRSVRHWYAQLNCTAVDFSNNHDAFNNLNHLG